MIAGALCGTGCGIVAWITYSALLPGGLGNGLFLTNTGNTVSMLIGNCVSIGVSLIVTIVTTLATNRHFDSENDTSVWENTRDIDSPLSPWPELFSK